MFGPRRPFKAVFVSRFSLLILWMKALKKEKRKKKKKKKNSTTVFGKGYCTIVHFCLWKKIHHGITTKGGNVLQTKTEHVLWAISNSSKIFWQIILASWNKLSEKLRNYIKILVGYGTLFLSYWSSQYFVFLSVTQKIVIPFSSFSYNLLQDAYIKIVHKTYCTQFWIGCNSPLNVFVNGSQLAKMKKSIPMTCPCHKIYRDEAVGLKSCKYTWKITIFVKMWNLGQYRENLIFCQ